MFLLFSRDVKRLFLPWGIVFYRKEVGSVHVIPPEQSVGVFRMRIKEAGVCESLSRLVKAVKSK